MADNNNGNNNSGGGGDGRGQVTDPETDLRVGNKTGNMGKSFQDNPELASAAGRKGGAHRGSGDTAPNEKELNEDIQRASQGGGGGGNDDGGGNRQGSNSGGGGNNRGNQNSGGNNNRSGGGNSGNRGQISQKEAVYNAVTSVLGTNEFDGKVELTGDTRQQVRQQVFEQFKNGEVSFGGDLPDDRQLLTYCSGLISNWLRKDGRLNGGERYQPKNPGSRAGSGDEMMKAMKALLAATTEPKARKEIQDEINKRQEELRPKRAQVNLDALPENLRKYATQG